MKRNLSDHDPPVGQPSGDESPAVRTVQSVDRALAILETVSQGNELGVTEIAGQVGLHVATTHNLLRTLCARHYLRNVNGRYRLGPAMTVLTSRGNPLLTLPGEIRPSLRRIAQDTGESASATVLVGGVGKLVGFEPGTQAITIQFPQWEWPQPLLLATGRLLAAHESPETRRRLVAANRRAEPGWSPADWEQAFERIRAEDLSATCLQTNDGQMAIAVPLRVAGGTVAAAIGISTPFFRAARAHVEVSLRVLRREAAALSVSLGWTGAPEAVPPADLSPYCLPDSQPPAWPEE